MGETKKTLFKGDYHPAAFHKGGEKITGYEVQTVSGADITVEDTYNDRLNPAVQGNGMQNKTPSPDAPVYPVFSNGALNSEGLNLLPDTAEFTSSTRDGDVFTFADQVYDRILRKKYWTPKEDTEYTIVLDILENTFTDEMVLLSDNRFYFKEMRYAIPIGMIGRAAVNVKTWSSFDNVTSGSIWLNTPNTVTGIFKAKVSILLGTYRVDNLPEYQPYRPPVSIELPILRAIPDGNGGFSARDSLTAVEGMPGWYDLRREVREEQVTQLIKNDITFGSYYYCCNILDGAKGSKLSSHFRFNAAGAYNRIGFFTDIDFQFAKALYFWMEGIVSADNAALTDNTEASAWLQAQADAGTPLTVWYPLEEPTAERIELGELSTYPYNTHIYTDCAVKPMIEADLKRMNTRVRKITDSDESYAKAVPDGADHASVEMIGGRTEAADGGLVSAEVESVKCNGSVMGKIPGAVRALTGYGWSAGSAYNSIERTDTGWRFVQRVDALVLTGLKWQSANGDYPHKVYYVAADDLPPDVKASENFIAGRYANAGNGGWGAVGANDRQITINSYTGAINLSDDHFDPSNAGSMYYERKEPIITDVTGLMSDFPKGFAVESGGTLTLENPAEMPVPNTITYLIKE